MYAVQIRIDFFKMNIYILQIDSKIVLNTLT